MHTADAGMHTTDASMHTADASMYAAVLKVHGPNELTKHCETSCFIFTSERKGHSRKGSVPTVRAQHLAWEPQDYESSFQVLLTLGVLSISTVDI